MAAKPIDFDAIVRRARQSLGKLDWWNKLGQPADDPRLVGQWLRQAASDLPSDLTRHKNFLSALHATAAWSDAEELRQVALELWDHPAINAVVGSHENKVWLWNHPDAAFNFFIRHSLDHPAAYRDEGPLNAALTAISTAVNWHEDHASGPEPSDRPESGVSGDRQGASPGPSRASARETPDARFDREAEAAQAHRERGYASGEPEKFSAEWWSWAAENRSGEEIMAEADGHRATHRNRFGIGNHADRYGEPEKPATRSAGRSPSSYQALIAKPKLSEREYQHLLELAAERLPYDGPDDPEFGTETQWPASVGAPEPQQRAAPGSKADIANLEWQEALEHRSWTHPGEDDDAPI